MSKSEVVSAMGVVLSVVQGIMKEAQKAGGGDKDFYLLSKPEGEDALRQIGQIIADLGRKVGEICILTVDYDISLRGAISAGEYNYVNQDITVGRFPAYGHEEEKKEVAFKLFHFNRLITRDEVIFEMDKQGFRPASLRELLAYSKANPNLQRQFPIIALLPVSALSCGCCVPGLWGNTRERDLSLVCVEDLLSPDFRFLAVRK